MLLDKNNYIDFHCHPAMKPLGKSFNYKIKGVNNHLRSRSNSIWHYNPPSLSDKLLNYIIQLTKFSQANFTSLSRGGVSIVCVSLYPIERGFFDNKIKPEFLKDIASNFVSCIGKKRVDTVQGMTNYFEDLELEYNFYMQLNNKIVNLPEGKVKYTLVKNYSEIESLLKEESMDVKSIGVFTSIEGLHVLNTNINKPPDENQFLLNIEKIKSWESPPLFVTVAHHFWNYLCGHAESFTSLLKKYADQSEGKNTGFTNLGRKVVSELLGSKNGRRILIDVKHMSVASRKEYYKILDSTPDYKNIPIVVSHGAANGLIDFDNQNIGGSLVANKLKQGDINFFNSEIIRIAKSKGIFGLQLDERRIANKSTLKATKNSISRSKIMHYRSELLWNQIQHIAELLDDANLFIWDCIVLGTDFDGIIDPLNAFWTAEELPYLADFLERHAFNYLQTKTFKLDKNNIQADEIISRLMSTNGLKFLQANFN